MTTDDDKQNENDDEDDDEKSPVNSLACCVISPDVTCPPVGLEVVLKGGLFDTVFIMVIWYGWYGLIDTDTY